MEASPVADSLEKGISACEDHIHRRGWCINDEDEDDEARDSTCDADETERKEKERIG